MRCPEACELLSARFDGEPVADAELGSARVHAASCAECSAFMRVLERSASVPGPAASPALVARVLESVGRESADARAAEALEHVPAAPRARRWRVPRLAVVASAAVLVLAAMSATTLYLASQPMSGPETASLEPDSARSGGDPMMAAPAPDAAAEQSAGAAIAAAAPPYVTLDGEVWVLVERTAPAPSAPTTAGVVVTALDSPAAPVERTARYDGGRTSLYVEDAGVILRFERVVRTLGRAPYGLVSGAPLTRFGEWPTLPARFAPPASADGSPTFRRFGFDDLNADVFVPRAGRIADGLAVPPGMPVDDPAAGNPGWTWWEPLP